MGVAARYELTGLQTQPQHDRNRLIESWSDCQRCLISLSAHTDWPGICPARFRLPPTKAKQVLAAGDIATLRQSKQLRRVQVANPDPE